MLIIILVAFFVAFILGIIMMPFAMFFLKNVMNYVQPISPYTGHVKLQNKNDVPTMGGITIIASIIATSLIFSDYKDPEVWVLLSTLILFGILGAIDDGLKLHQKNHKGVTAKYKLIAQCFLALFSILLIKIFVFSSGNVEFSKTHLFYGGLINFGLLYIPFTTLTIVSSTNAVNLTDGLDGLAIFPVIILVTILGIISYVNDMSFNVTLFCAMIAGSSLSFLWYNAYPAKIFMGDMGSLSLGAVLAVISILLKREMIFMVASGLFVLETVSVVLQVAYFKLTFGKRIFLMSPLHHHFEKKGLHEATIVVRCWIVSIIFAILGLLINNFLA